MECLFFYLFSSLLQCSWLKRSWRRRGKKRRDGAAGCHHCIKTVSKYQMWNCCIAVPLSHSFVMSVNEQRTWQHFSYQGKMLHFWQHIYLGFWLFWTTARKTPASSFVRGVRVLAHNISVHMISIRIYLFLLIYTAIKRPYYALHHTSIDGFRTQHSHDLHVI